MAFTQYGMGTKCSNQIVDRRAPEIVTHDVKDTDYF